MIDGRKITCTSSNGNSITLGSEFNPFLLIDADGLYQVDASVTTSDNGMLDGSTYVGTNLKERNIVLTIVDKADHLSNRNFLYLVFAPKSVGTLTYYEKDGDEVEERSIDYYVESIDVASQKPLRTSTISLICNDPYFTDKSNTEVEMTGWQDEFEFEHEFLETGEEFATIIVQKTVEIKNESTIDSLGMQIVIDAEGDIVNPKVYHLESDSYIQLGNDINLFTMQYGDELVISTVQNDKNAYLIRDGFKENANEYINEGSTYIQLINGLNTVNYSAEDGEDNMRVLITYKNKYLGV